MEAAKIVQKQPKEAANILRRREVRTGNHLSAANFATLAISQLKRIQADHVDAVPMLDRVIQWCENRKGELA